MNSHHTDNNSSYSITNNNDQTDDSGIISIYAHENLQFKSIITPPPHNSGSSSTSRFSSTSRTSSTSSAIATSNKRGFFQNANLPPMPPKTPFMCFSESKNNDESKSSLKNLAEEWRLLSASEKEYWDEQARKDRSRYIKAKASFIPTPESLPKRRAKKHPLAPKRPMSAFLKFSLNRRKSVKAGHPDMNNTDISRLLGEMWRNASEEEKRPYVETELKERQKYKEDIKHWRLIQEKKEADEAFGSKEKITHVKNTFTPVVQEDLSRQFYPPSVNFSSKQDIDNQSISSWGQLNRAIKFEDDDNQLGEFNNKFQYSPTRDNRQQSYSYFHNDHSSQHHPHQHPHHHHQHQHAPTEAISQPSHHWHHHHHERCDDRRHFPRSEVDSQPISQQQHCCHYNQRGVKNDSKYPGSYMEYYAEEFPQIEPDYHESGQNRSNKDYTEDYDQYKKNSSYHHCFN